MSIDCHWGTSTCWEKSGGGSPIMKRYGHFFIQNQIYYSCNFCLKRAQGKLKEIN